MKPDTLKQLRNINITRHNVSAVNKQLNADAQKAIDFMETLVKKGIPLEQINTTDWNSAPIKVFVNIPYGKKGGGKRKEFKRFSDREVASAMKFWKDPKCEGGLLMKNAGKVSPRSKGKKDVGNTEGALKDIKSIEHYVNFSIKGNAHQFEDTDPDYNRMMNDHSVYLSDKEFLEKYKDKFGTRSFDDDEFEENGNMEEFRATEEYYITFKDDSEITVDFSIPNGDFINADVRDDENKNSMANKWIGEFNKKGWNMDIDELHQKSKANSKWSGGEASPRANRQQMIKGGSADLLNKIKTEGKISEKDINLIKNRMNNDKMDAETTELVQWIWDNTPELTAEQNERALSFLKNLWKSPRGKERTNNPFGYREQEALEKFKRFDLAGFHDISRYGGRKFYVPLYDVIGEDGSSFQYYYDGKVHIVGATGGQMKNAGQVSPRKARQILHDKKVHGKPLSEAQRSFFGARASGYPAKKADAGKAGDKFDGRFTKVKSTAKSTASLNQKPIIIGLTEDDNIFWVEVSNNINPWGSDPQPDRGFSMSGSTSDIYSMDGAKKYAKQYWKDFFEGEPEQLSDMNERMGTKFRSASAGAKYVLDTDGELHGFDQDTALGEVEYKGKTYIFHSQSGGQLTDTMDEDVLKKIYVDKQTFETLKRLWNKFHMKQLPSKEGIPLIEQDKDAILQDAIKTTGKKYCGGGDVEMNEGGKIKTIADLKEKNKELGHHFFSPETMRFFGSKIESGILGGNYFITSEKNFDDTKREFKVRSFAQNGKVNGNPLGKTFETKEQAKDAIKEHTKKLLHGGKSSSAPAYAKAGKAGADMNYEKDILPVLKESVQSAWKPIMNKYRIYKKNDSEIESRSGDGFIAFTNGGYTINGYTPLDEFDGTGIKMPTEKSQKQIDKWIQECYDESKEKVGDDDSEEFRDEYSECLGRISVDFDLRAIYYAPDNDRSEFKGKRSVYVIGIINDDLKDRKDLIEEGFSFDNASELNTKLETAMNKVLAWFKADGSTKDSGGKPSSDSNYAKAGKAGKENPYYVKPISGETRKLFRSLGLEVLRNTTNGLYVAEKLEKGHLTGMYGLYTHDGEEVAPPIYQMIDGEVNANGMTRVTHADGSSGAIEAFVVEMGNAGKAGGGKMDRSNVTVYVRLPHDTKTGIGDGSELAETISKAINRKWSDGKPFEVKVDKIYSPIYSTFSIKVPKEKQKVFDEGALFIDTIKKAVGKKYGIEYMYDKYGWVGFVNWYMGKKNEKVYSAMLAEAKEDKKGAIKIEKEEGRQNKWIIDDLDLPVEEIARNKYNYLGMRAHATGKVYGSNQPIDKPAKEKWEKLSGEEIKESGGSSKYAKAGKAGEGYKKFTEGIKVKVDEAYLRDEASPEGASATATVMSEPSDKEELVQIKYEDGSIDYLGQDWLEPIGSKGNGGGADDLKFKKGEKVKVILTKNTDGRTGEVEGIILQPSSGLSQLVKYMVDGKEVTKLKEYNETVFPLSMGNGGGGKFREVEGTYGSGKTPSTIFVAENRDGSRWYVAEGGTMVNKTYDDIQEGVNIEELSDDDVYTVSKKINSLSDLEASLEDEPYKNAGKAGSGIKSIHDHDVIAYKDGNRATYFVDKIGDGYRIIRHTGSVLMPFEFNTDKNWEKIFKENFDSYEVIMGTGGVGDIELTSKELEDFNRIHNKYVAKDYFGTNDRIEMREKYRQQLAEKGNQEAINTTRKDIEVAFRKKEHEDGLNYFRKLKSIINQGDKKELKSRLRASQKMTIELVEVLTGKSLKGYTNQKQLDDFVDSLSPVVMGKGGEMPTWEYTSGMEWSPNQVLQLFIEKAKQKHGKELDHEDKVALMTEAKEQVKHGLDMDDIYRILEDYFPVEEEMGKAGAIPKSLNQKENATAIKEGWAISNNEAGDTVIQKWDEAGVFKNDKEARVFVLKKAMKGSALHKKAMALTETDKSKGEFDSDIQAFIDKEKNEKVPYTYRTKILFGQEVVLKEDMNRTPKEKLVVGDWELAKRVEAVLNKNAKKPAKGSGNKKLNGGSDFETGATSHEVNELILHADNDARLAGERDGIYQMAVNGNWNNARLHQQFKRIFSYMTETSYNKEVPSEKIQLNEEQRNEFAQLYTDGFTNWKRDKGISMQTAGEAGDNGNNNDTMENENNNNGQENGLTNGEENGDNGNGTEPEPETPEVPEIPEPATPEISDSTAKLRQAVETLKSAEDHSHASDGAIESATRNVQEVVEELETPQLGNGGYSKKVSPDKQKMKEKIEKIEDALDSDKTSAQSRERLSKELATLRTQYERRVPVAERMSMSKGKFYIEMPLEYRETMNGLLWGKNIRPHYTALGDSLRISVDSKPRLNKVYSIYSNMLKKKDLPVPSLESISGKPAKVRRRR